MMIKKAEIKKKRWKEGVLMLPAVAVGLGVFIGLSGIEIPTANIKFPDEVVAAVPKQQEARENSISLRERVNRKKEKTGKSSHEKVLIQADYDGEGIWQDGTYSGSGTGFGGLITVLVTISKGRITDIIVTSHPGETPEYFTKASAIVPKILSAQTPNVDTVSGATYSSNGIKQAVIMALNKAGASLKLPEGNGKTSKKNTDKEGKEPENKEEKTVTGIPADGVFEGSAICENFDYTVHVKARHLLFGIYPVATILLVLIISGMFFQERFFCQFFCPMGAVFSLLPEVPLFRLKRNARQCINGCQACRNQFPVHIKLGEEALQEGECIRCGRCRQICPKVNIAILSKSGFR